MKKNELEIFKNIRNGLCFFLMAGLVACTGETTDTTVGGEAVDGAVVEAGVETDTWDTNEFNSTFASNNYYEEWDTNRDNMLDMNEYNKGMYGVWDKNNDNRLDENEWNTASNDFGLENETWSDWDTTADGMLDENEFTTGFTDNNWFNTWDADRNTFLEEREYTDGLFGQWDVNNDNMLDGNEFGMYNNYFGI